MRTVDSYLRGMRKATAVLTANAQAATRNRVFLSGHKVQKADQNGDRGGVSSGGSSGKRASGGSKVRTSLGDSLMVLLFGLSYGWVC